MAREFASTFPLPVPGGLAVWCVGVGLLQTLAMLPRPAWWPLAGTLTLLAGAAALQPQGWRRCIARRAVALTACVLAGVTYAAWRAELRLADALPPEWEGEDVTVVGVVDELAVPCFHNWRQD